MLLSINSLMISFNQLNLGNYFAEFLPYKDLLAFRFYLSFFVIFIMASFSIVQADLDHKKKFLLMKIFSKKVVSELLAIKSFVLPREYINAP